MKKINKFFPFLLLIVAISLPNITNAQSTWDQVYNILSTKCAGGSCHSTGSSAPGFELTNKADVYNQLINSTPTNPYAANNKMKTIKPGYPQLSFLLRKVSHGLGAYQSADITPVIDEGAVMPQGLPALNKTQVEIIRQWILAGADNSTAYGTADTTLISTYYNIGGRAPIQAPAPPAPGEGIQIHLGPIFMGPNEEHEYFLKHDLFLDNNVEVTSLNLVMNDESHHFILRKFAPNTKANWPEGMALLNALTAFDSDKDYVMAWQNDENFELPVGTAYFWDTATALDLNYHLINPYNEILPFELYLNVATQAAGTAEKEMKSSLINNAVIVIPNDGQMHEFSDNAGFSNKSIWTLASHTHSRGVGYDIYLNGINGASDSMIYNGYINYNTGVNQGYYDWEHPFTRFFEPFSEALFDTTANGQLKYDGFTHKARYVSNESRPLPLTFGFTSNDEMMIFYVQYVDGIYKVPGDTSTVPTDTTGVGVELFITDNSFNVYPNPIEDVARISFALKSDATVSLQIIDVLGREVAGILSEENLNLGEHVYNLDEETLQQNGVYFVKLTVNGASIIQKIVKTN